MHPHPPEFYFAKSAGPTTLHFNMRVEHPTPVDNIRRNGNVLAHKLLDIIPAIMMDEIRTVFVTELVKSLVALNNAEAYDIANKLSGAYLEAIDADKNWHKFVRGG